MTGTAIYRQRAQAHHGRTPGWAWKECIFAVFAILLLPPHAWAGTVGFIEGTTTDAKTGDPLPGVNVLLVGTVTGATADNSGRFSIPNIPAGLYEIRATLVGYRPARVTEIRVVADLRTRVEIRLQAAPVEMQEIVTEAQQPPILKDVTGTVHTIDARQIETLPITTPQEIVALQPGVTGDLHIRGGKTTESVYLIDGLPVQDAISGGIGAELPRSSIVSMKVETGGYEAEHGNALSGVINIVTNTGTNEHRVLARAEADDLFGGEQVDHRAQAEISGGGPIVTDKLFYFATLAGTFSDTRYWQDLSRFFPSPITKAYTVFGKLSYHITPALRVSGQALGFSHQWRDYEFSWRFNLDGLPERTQSTRRLAFMLDQTVSPQFFYSASVSQYHSSSRIGPEELASLDTSLYQYDFYLQYIVDGNRSWQAENRQTINTVKSDLTYQFAQHHLLKAGAILNLYSIYNEVTRYEPRTNIWGKPFLNKPLLNYSSDYSYNPYSVSAYIQDKIELTRDGMLLNVGLRYDMLNPRAERPAAERVPVTEDEYETVITGYVPASTKHEFSPRVGFSAPFAEQGYLFINYGHYVQFPLFDYLYSGLNNVTLKRGFGTLVGNPDLEPEKTKAWEISVKYAFQDNILLSTTYFDKTTYNQIDIKTFVPTNARVAGDFGFAEFVNNPYAKARGVEFLIAREKHDVLTGSLSYTYMKAEGLSEDARQGLAYYQWGFAPPPKLFPLSWDQRHSIKLIANVALPWEIGLSLLWTFASGRPYTYYPTSDGFTPADSTLTFMPNNARMADVSLMDLKVSKLWTISEFLRLTIYLDIRNLLDRRNVNWVDSSGKIGGELGSVTGYGYPRRVRLGLRVDI